MPTESVIHSVRTNHKVIRIIALFFVVHFHCQAQNTDDIQLYNIHEDPIRPGMISLYEETTTLLAEGLKEFNIDVNFFTIQCSDLKYMFFRPVKSLGTLGENSWGKLKPHMPERYNMISADFKKCFDSHYSYILELYRHLSYNEEKIEGPRRLIYLYVAPEHLSAFIKLARELKSNFEVDKAEIGYRLFKSGYGCADNFFMIEVSSRQAESFSKSFKNYESFRNKILNLTLRIEDINATFRGDLSYSKSNKN